jgi:hypothetical protein
MILTLQIPRVRWIDRFGDCFRDFSTGIGAECITMSLELTGGDRIRRSWLGERLAYLSRGLGLLVQINAIL